MKNITTKNSLFELVKVIVNIAFTIRKKKLGSIYVCKKIDLLDSVGVNGALMI